MPPHLAAWAMAPFDPLVVAAAPHTPPGPGQILVQNRAVAINPVDRYKQKMGKMLYGWVKYPCIMGNDLAGDVVDVGEGVTRFVIGDRVLANATGMEKSRNRASEGAFQSHTVVMAHMAAAIPDAMTHAAACVLPLGLSTAACGLFGADQLALTAPTAAPADQGQTVLIWSGSSSVGCNAIQLAVAAGYRVVTTASPRNAELVRGLGAAEVFDHASPTVVADLRRALTGVTMAGAVAIGPGSAAACIAALAGCMGQRKVAIATFPLDIDSLPDRAGPATMLTRVVPKMVAGGAGLWWAAWRAGVKTSVIWGTALMDTNLSRVIYADFLPQALARGQFVAAPEPLIVGHGLAAIQDGFARQAQGVSAAKVVITL